MKKLAISSAVAAAAMISTGVNAAISSNVTGGQVFIGNINIEAGCPPPGSYLNIGGTLPDVTLTGVVCVDPNLNGMPFVRLRFNLGGTYALGSGTTFDGGAIGIDVDTGSGWVFYAAITATPTNPILCLSGMVGHLGTNTTAGLQIPASGTSALPGPWIGGTGIDAATCVTTQVGQTVGLFLDGTVSN